VLGRFRAVYDKMNLALDEMPYSQIGISDEVKEQVHPLSLFLGYVCLFLLLSLSLIPKVQMHW
jgi:hypothetical protein